MVRHTISALLRSVLLVITLADVAVGLRTGPHGILFLVVSAKRVQVVTPPPQNAPSSESDCEEVTRVRRERDPGNKQV